MIALPITMGILMVSLIVMQHEHYCQCDRVKTAEAIISEESEIEKLRKEFTEYKKRVDTLTLKAGFKI